MPVLDTDSTWILLISLGSIWEKIITHQREGRSLAQGDWAAELDQSPDLSQRFSSSRGRGRVWLCGGLLCLPEQKAVNSPFPTLHTQLK